MSRTKHHGSKAKQRKFGDAWSWLQATPGWWINLFMTRPQRHKARAWERDAAKTSNADLDALDAPPHGKKPHKYFW